MLSESSHVVKILNIWEFLTELKDELKIIAALC